MLPYVLVAGFVGGVFSLLFFPFPFFFMEVVWVEGLLGRGVGKLGCGVGQVKKQFS